MRPTADKLRFGICGLGAMGRVHFACLAGNPYAEVIAVCDADPARRRGEWCDAIGNLDVIERIGGRVFWEGIVASASADEVIANPDVDAVVITLPTALHADVTVAALQAGKHVLCEKPMALTPAECDRMIAAAVESRRLLMVGQCIRFWPQYELVQQYVQSGRLGRIRYVNLRRLAAAPAYSAGNWMLDPRQSGGALLDLHVHDIDFLQHLLGLPETIAARGALGRTGAVDHVVAMYTYADGAYALLEGGWLHAPWPFEMRFTVHGERGTLEWSIHDGDAVRLYRETAPAGDSLGPGGGEPVAGNAAASKGKPATVVAPEAIPCPGDAYEREDAYFVDCVRCERSVERCTPASTRTSIALALLERQAIETGAVISVREVC